ncbi:MAG: cation:dicarboxylase symporter family transporter [Firmicutes bacterium]|nr:cation:dicarboxylase symporter family transporter [Bacillota bacterium]
MSIIKYENFSEEYILNESSIDQMAAKVEEFLYSLGMERANVLGIRLSIEEALLRWLDHFSAKDEETKVKFYTGKSFFRPSIDIELKGEEMDPLHTAEGDLDAGDWIGTAMANIGLSPRFSYAKGINTLHLRLNRPGRNPGLGLLLGILAGLVIGFATKAVLPEESVEALTNSFFGPVQDVFFRLLKGTAGPVIFFTVLTAICGIGSAAVMNKSGKKLIRRFILSSTVMTVAFVIIMQFTIRPDFMSSPLKNTVVSLFNAFLDFVPGDIISPFLNTDSPMLIVLAIIIGNALLVLGNQGDRLVKIANQANSVGLLVAEWISRLIPYFVAILLAFRILDGTIVRFRTIWIPLLAFHIFAAVYFGIKLLWISKKFEVPAKKLWDKIKPSLMIAFRNASVDAAFGENRLCCERKLGINGKLADYGLPLGLVIYMPVSTVSLMASTLYAVKCYNMTITTLWLIMAVILVVALQAASPPVSGVDTLAYVAIFSRLGIPSEALIMAIICDIIFCFTSSALNQAMLQLHLIEEADRLNSLDINVLRR